MDEFKEKYFEVFGKVYKFLRENYKPSTVEEWNKIARAVAEFDSPIGRELYAAAVNEIERINKNHEH